MAFSSVHNTHEKTIFDAVVAAAPGYPALADDVELLADVACVALNRMPSHYIRHSTDLAFFTTETERQAIRRKVEESVDFAFGYVQARHIMAARR
ncbi:MAG: late competence development ComFB family protein [Microbacteriaceae bacterium]|nr:late competence development ComFB family protein [Burkholderiaceae bacterium]